MIAIANGDEDAGGHATLSCAAGEGGDNIFCGDFDIGVWDDHEMIFGTAESEHPFSGVDAALVDEFGDGSGTDKGGCCDAGVVKDGFDSGAVALNDIENAVGEAGLLEEFGESEWGEGDLLRGLENEGVAAGDGDGEHPHGNHGGKVEGGDACDHAERESAGVAIDAWADFEEFAGDELWEGAGVFDDFETFFDTGFGFGGELAVFARNEEGEFVDILFDEVFEFEEDLDAVFDREGRPRGESLVGDGDDAIDFGGVAESEVAQNGTVERAGDFAGSVAGDGLAETGDEVGDGRDG
jgi:hypothetical protein